MKFKLLPLLLIVFFSSCATTKEFPVSQIAPSAEMKVKYNQDKYDNYIFEVSTEFLTDPQRLSPPKSVYVFWVETESNGVMNLGRLDSKTTDKAKIKTLTPFEPKTVFITAETTSDVRKPAGIEISRLKIK